MILRNNGGRRPGPQGACGCSVKINIDNSKADGRRRGASRGVTLAFAAAGVNR